jgi:predicted nucleic acid-binding protein
MPKADDAASGEPTLTSEPPSVVLDTNVVLDWFVFGEPSVAALAVAVTGGRVRWLATAAMRDEMAHVLGRGLAAARGADLALVAAAWDRHCTQHPPAPPAAAHMRCTDTDDQKFIDLALASCARWLISRDRALLKLRRRAAKHGLIIAPPDQWRLE